MTDDPLDDPEQYDPSVDITSNEDRANDEAQEILDEAEDAMDATAARTGPPRSHVLWKVRCPVCNGPVDHVWAEDQEWNWCTACDAEIES
jgi:hypothetical protein